MSGATGAPGVQSGLAPIQLVGMGALAPVGLEPRAIAAAVRAGLSRFAESEWLLRKRDGEPIRVSLLATLEFRLSARERMRQLAIDAGVQAIAPLVQGSRWPAGASIPMVLSVPPRRPGLEAGDGATLAREIMSALPLPPDKRLSGVFDTGREGGLAALSYAAGLFATRKAEVCLVGGIDSPRDVELLHWLEGLGRLKDEETPSGFIPGEGAAFLLVCSEEFRRRVNLTSFGAVTPPVQAMEPNPWYLGKPCLGEGLTEAVRRALATGLPGSAPAGTVWADLNGESWRVDEWMYAYLRTTDRHGEPLRLRHPADCLGDLGAATGPMLVTLAALDLAHPRTEVNSALVFVASDTRPHRSACVVLKA